MLTIDVQKPLQAANGSMLLDVQLEVEAGEFIVLYGPSGAGKTTLLRILAGLTDVASGSIQVAGAEWLDSERNLNLQPRQRSVGMVFQNYALFPNMTVAGNLRYAAARGQSAEFIDHLLDITGLSKLAERKPDTLSGGQQQRVALARAIARRPSLLLLDEPLSALDPAMRRQLQDEILKIHREFRITTIMVSHDLSEIFRLANRVAVIENGRITRCGSLTDIFIEKKLSGKFKFQGILLEKKASDVVFIMTVSIGNHIVKVIATEEEAAKFQVGDPVIVSSKAFNPVLLPVSKTQ